MSRDRKTSTSGGEFTGFSALAIGAISIIAIVLLTTVAFVNSRNAIRQAVAKANLSLGQSVCRLSIAQPSPLPPARRLEQLRKTWAQTDSPYQGTYMCVIGPAGTLDLHTLKPEMAGTDVSQVVVSEKSGETVGELLHAQKSWSGQNTNFRGVRQLVGYHYEPSLNSLVAVHVPAKVVDEGFAAVVSPWINAMALTTLVLLPSSLGLLFFHARRANRIAQSRLLDARTSDERYKGFVETSSEGIYCCEFDTPMPISLPEDDQVVALYSGCHLVVCNDVFARMYGYDSGSEMVGIRAIELYGTSDNEANLQFLRQMVRNNYRVADAVSEEFDRNGKPLIFNNSCLGIVEDDHLVRVWGTQLDITAKVRDQRKLLESELRHRELIENSPVCIHELSLDGKWDSVNSAGLKMLKLSDASKLIGAPYLDVVGEADKERVSRLFDEAVAGKVSNFTFQALDDDFYESSFVPMRDVDGAVRHVMGISQNITERLTALQRIQTSERLYRTLFEQAAVGVAQIDSINRNILEVNNRYCEIVGYSRNELRTMEFASITHPDDLAPDLRQMDRLILGEIREFNLEKRLLRKDQATVWVKLTVSPMWSPGEAPSTHIAIVADITEQREAQLRLAESESRFRTLCDTAPVGIFLIGLDGECTYVNEKCCELIGMRADAALGTGWRQALAPDDRESVTSRWREALGSGSNFTSQHRLLHENGNELTVRTDATIRHDAQGQPIGYVGTVIDLTDMVRASAELQKVQGEMAHLSRISMVSEMAADISHELNQPLSAIANYATVCRMKLPAIDGEFAELAKYLDHINEMALQSGQVVRSLRTYSQHRPAASQTIGVGELIHGALNVMKFVTQSSHVNVNLDLPSPDIVVHVEPAQIRQVIVNLISNAVDAMEDVPKEARELWISAKATGEMVEVAVTDVGQGLPNIGRPVFDPFVSTKPDGIGIGLSISTRIIESHDGALTGENNQDRGATFRFRIPVRKSEHSNS